MDSLKKPEVALSAAAMATSIGVGIYSYNSINELKIGVIEIKEGISKVTNILSQSKDHGTLINNIRHILENLEKSLEQHDKIIDNLSKDISETNNKFDNIYKDINQIKYTLSSELGYNQQSYGAQNTYQDEMTMPLPMKSTSHQYVSDLTYPNTNTGQQSYENYNVGTSQQSQYPYQNTDRTSYSSSPILLIKKLFSDSSL